MRILADGASFPPFSSSLRIVILDQLGNTIPPPLYFVSASRAKIFLYLRAFDSMQTLDFRSGLTISSAMHRTLFTSKASRNFRASF